MPELTSAPSQHKEAYSSISVPKAPLAAEGISPLSFVYTLRSERPDAQAGILALASGSTHSLIRNAMHLYTEIHTLPSHSKGKLIVSLSFLL